VFLRLPWKETERTEAKEEDAGRETFKINPCIGTDALSVQARRRRNSSAVSVLGDSISIDPSSMFSMYILIIYFVLVFAAALFAPWLPLIVLV
jgi:hypothetical protein